jgi:DNA-binding beta-propeller fold protein YncE
VAAGHLLRLSASATSAFLDFVSPGSRAECSWGRSMGRFRCHVPDVVLFLLASLATGCGGGSSFVQPPPPSPDFSIALSTNSISVAQGATSPAVTISITSLNGFTGSVQVTLGTLPAGVTSNPTSPFTVAVGVSTSVLFGATANAVTGNFPVSAQGTSGNLSHSTNLALTVQSGVLSALPRTTYARTDATFAADNPFGEPHHRHIAYDPANKHLFIANRAMNRVEVFSTSDQRRIAQISVSGASSAELSADGATVWIGTSLEHIAAVDTASLRVKARYFLAGLTPLPGTIFNRPVELLSLSNGKSMIRLRQPVSSEALLALWDPTTNSLTDLTSTAPVLFQQGVGVLARSSDGSKVLTAANDSSGELALYNSLANVVAGPLTIGTGSISRVAANLDGTRFAVVFTSNGNTQLLLLDASLQQVAVYLPASVHGVAFSRDGKYLYVCESSSTASFITILDGRTAKFIGQIPDASIQGVSSDIEDADETQLLFALSNRGVSFLDASTPGTLPTQMPLLAAAPSLLPSDGPVAGGTPVVLSGQNFAASAQLKFGTQSAASINVSGPTQIQANSPPSVISGSVNVTAFFPNGWLALAPDAFSYGPQILQTLPNAGVSAGGDSVWIYGYGFGSDAGKITAKIGGAIATVQKVENVTSIVSSLGIDANYPFSLQRLTIITPSGAPGKADVAVNAASGTATFPKSFQFLQSLKSSAKPGLYKFLLYDQMRQRIYLSSLDHVDVFDLSLGAFLTAIQPPGGPPPNAGLRGLALTPDGTQLIVADFGAQNVYLIDPVKGTGTTVPVGGVPGFTNSGPARVAATSTQTVFVGLSGEGGSSGACSTCLGQLDLTANPPIIQPAPQPEVKSLTGAPLLQSNAAGDHVFLAFSSAPGGPVALWTSNAPNQFVTSAAQASASDLATAADGATFSVQTNGATEFRASDLSLMAVPASAELAQVPGRVFVPGLTLHPSGALIYQPFLTGAPGSAGVKGGVDILDGHSGALRLRLFLPQQLMTDVDGLHGSFLATDENGQRLFAITSSDGAPQNAALTIVQLAAVPLGIGTISPSTVAAAGGTALTIRGSGFQSGIKVTINGKSASVTLKDASTLSLVTPALTPGPQQLTLTNPDGESVSLDAAITAN